MVQQGLGLDQGALMTDFPHDDYDRPQRDDDTIPLPELLSRIDQMPLQLLAWFAQQLKAWVNNAHLDKYQIERAMTSIMGFHDMMEKWAAEHVIHNKNPQLHEMRHWWGLFAHLYLPRDKD
jgi:hypothetical protein